MRLYSAKQENIPIVLLKISNQFIQTYLIVTDLTHHIITKLTNGLTIWLVQ